VAYNIIFDSVSINAVHLYLSVSRSTDGGPAFSTRENLVPRFPVPRFQRPNIEWRPKLAMSQGRRRVYAAFIARLPPSQLALHSDDHAAVGLRLLIRQVLPYLLISQLTFISEGRSPIRHLGTRGMAVQWFVLLIRINNNNRLIMNKVQFKS